MIFLFFLNLLLKSRRSILFFSLLLCFTVFPLLPCSLLILLLLGLLSLLARLHEVEELLGLLHQARVLILRCSCRLRSPMASSRLLLSLPWHRVFSSRPPSSPP